MSEYRKPEEVPSRFEALCVELQQVAFMHAKNQGQTDKYSSADGVVVAVQKGNEGWLVFAFGNGGTPRSLVALGSNVAGKGKTPELALEQAIENIKGAPGRKWKIWAKREF